MSHVKLVNSPFKPEQVKLKLVMMFKTLSRSNISATFKSIICLIEQIYRLSARAPKLEQSCRHLSSEALPSPHSLT